MKLLTVLFALLVLTCINPVAAAPKDPAAALESDGLGQMKLGQPAAAVLKLLGEPEKKGKDVEWAATGEWVQEWDFPKQGLTLNMASGKKGGAKTVGTITAIGACKLATKRGIAIGSPLADVRKAYGNVESKEDGQTKDTFIAGSVYGGIIFSLKGGKVSKIFVGAAAE